MVDWSKPHPDSRFMSVGGARLHYKQAGEGPAVLLLHGSGSSLQGFDAVAATLSRAFTTVRPDLPGFGLTGPMLDRDYRIETYVATVARFMRAIGFRRYAVIGNSLGGNIAWNLALDHSECVAALVIVNATGYPGKSLPSGLRLARNPFLRPLLRRWSPRSAVANSLRATVGRHADIVDEAMVDRVHSLMSLPGNRSAFIDIANTEQRDRSGDIARISTPTLILRSAQIDGQHFASDIVGSREHIHPDAGHLLPEEDPDWVARSVEQFLIAIGGSGSQAGADW